MPKTLRTLIGLLNLTLFGLLLVPTVAFGQTNADASSLTQSFVTAFNAGNQQAGSALFASDGVIRFNPSYTGPGNGTFTGTGQISTFFQGASQIKDQIQAPVTPQLNGGTATTTVRVTLPDLQPAGVDFAEYQMVVTIDTGKIKTLTFNATPDTITKFSKLGPPPGASGQGQGGNSSAAPGVPSTGTGGGAAANSTGGDSSNTTLILIGVGTLLVVGCVAIVSILKLRKPAKP